MAPLMTDSVSRSCVADFYADSSAKFSILIIVIKAAVSVGHERLTQKARLDALYEIRIDRLKGHVDPRMD